MSETLTNIAEQLINITVPNLNEAGYATQLSKTFTDINTNFVKLANKEFLKGENGDSVKIKEVDLIVAEGDHAGELTVFGSKLIAAIEANTDFNERADIVDINGNTLTWLDYFKANPGKLYIIYDSTAVTHDEDIAYSSLYYTFLDGRYINEKIGLIDPKAYQLTKDVSCIAVYDASLNDNTGGFNIMTNAFPTIYYEEGIGLCWKVNGAGTGIPVQGIPGKDGINASLYVVQATIAPSEGLGDASDGKVNKIFEAYYGFKDIDINTDLTVYNNSSALILAADESGAAGKDFYFGTLKIEEHNGKKELWAYCSPSTSITASVGTESFINAMKNIDILGTSDAASSTPRGLFIPMEDERMKKDENNNVIEEVQSVHLLSATSITNDEGSDSNLKTDVVFTPVNNYNAVTVDPEVQKNNIIVDKYLYLRIQETDDTITNNEDIAESIRYKGIFKYKLESVVTNNEAADFDVYQVGKDTNGSRVFGKLDTFEKDADGNIIKNPHSLSISDTTVAYYDPTQDKFVESTSSTDHWYSWTSDVRKRFRVIGDAEKPVGIYKWVLCTEAHDWDVDELLEAKNSEDNFTNYSFADHFRVIYTLDMTPGATSDFLWFDGYTFYSDGWNDGETQLNDRSRFYYNNKPIIRGWYTEMFTFVKFVPIYINEYALSNDTSLNLNYNVNITGDAQNPNKSITVHGNVNCDNLNVYKLTATGAIQNIYTEDKITGADGINLCKNDDGTFKFVVESDGDVVAHRGIRTNAINCTNLVPIVNPDTGLVDWDSEVPSEDNTVITKALKADNATIKDISITPNNNASLTIGPSEIKSDYLGVDITNVNDINIKATTYYEQSESSKTTDHNGKVPVVYSDVPVLMNGSSNIVVTNQDKGSELLYYKSVKRDSNSKKPAGEGVNVNEIDFDSAKNFNINRFYSDSIATKSISVDKNGIGQGTLGKSNGIWKNIIYSEFSSTGGAITKTTSSITRETIDSHSIQKITITNDTTLSDGTKLSGIDSSNSIKIPFLKDFICHVGIKGCCSNGRWPVLRKTDSWIILKLWMQSAEDSAPTLLVTGKTYSFDYSSDNWNNGNGYEWCGYNDAGNAISGYDTTWRYHAFKFKPHEFTISGSNLTNLISKVSADKAVTLYITAEASISAKGQKNMWGNPKSVISGLWLSCPRPTSSNGTASTTMKKQGGTALNFNADYTGSKVTLNYFSVNDSSSDVKSTVICTDGIVTRAGTYTFGLGYATHWADHTNGKYTQDSGTSLWDTNYIKENGEPVLFYYNQNEWKWTRSDNPSNSKHGYARRVNAIRLSELFNALKVLRTNEDLKFGL